MRVIADLADDARVVLSLDARSFGEITIPDDRLIDWYGRFGFRETVSDTLESGMPMAVCQERAGSDGSAVLHTR
jgi:hypothetical protein